MSCGWHQGCAGWVAEPLRWEGGSQKGLLRLAVRPPGTLLGPVAEHWDL